MTSENRKGRGKMLTDDEAAELSRSVEIDREKYGHYEFTIEVEGYELRALLDEREELLKAVKKAEMVSSVVAWQLERGGSPGAPTLLREVRDAARAVLKSPDADE